MLLTTMTSDHALVRSPPTPSRLLASNYPHELSSKTAGIRLRHWRLCGLIIGMRTAHRPRYSSLTWQDLGRLGTKKQRRVGQRHVNLAKESCMVAYVPKEPLEKVVERACWSSRRNAPLDYPNTKWNFR